MISIVMITALLSSVNATAHSREWIIWLCVGITLFLAFGVRMLKWAIRYNKKHHIVEWDEGREITIEWNEENK